MGVNASLSEASVNTEDHDSTSPMLSLISSCSSSLDGHHSLMAAHDDGASTLCNDDLQALFELAEMLFAKPNGATSSDEHESHSMVNMQGFWLRGRGVIV